MRFLIDESLGSRFAKVLSANGYNILFAGDIMRGAPDENVLSFAEKENLVVITDDKDFGELVFRLKHPTKGVILLRASTTNPEKLFEMAKDSLYKSKDKFTVVSEGQVRVRKL
ncbi:MAG: DUF5615 family PIN-like protein [Nanoarchaeota archaeon]